MLTSVKLDTCPQDSAHIRLEASNESQLVDIAR